MKTLTLLLLLVFSRFSYAEVYKWTDLDGRVHFSDKKPTSGNAEELDLKINTYTTTSFDKSIFDVGPKVVMYSTSSCVYCKKARKYFNKNNTPFTDYNIQKNARAKSEYVKMGARGVPVILVGNKRLNGFSIKGFESIYK